MPTPYTGQVVLYYPDMTERSGWPSDKPYPAIVTQTKIAIGKKPLVNLQVFHPNGERLAKADIVFALGEEIPTAGQAGIITD